MKIMNHPRFKIALIWSVLFVMSLQTSTTVFAAAGVPSLNPPGGPITPIFTGVNAGYVKANSVVTIVLDVLNQICFNGYCGTNGEVIGIDENGELGWMDSGALSSLWQTVPSTTTDIYYNEGKVGVGTSSPTSFLEVLNPMPNTSSSLLAPTKVARFAAVSDAVARAGASIILGNSNVGATAVSPATDHAQIWTRDEYDNGEPGGSLHFSVKDGSPMKEVMSISRQGNVYIGKDEPAALMVDGVTISSVADVAPIQVGVMNLSTIGINTVAYNGIGFTGISNSGIDSADYRFTHVNIPEYTLNLKDTVNIGDVYVRGNIRANSLLGGDTRGGIYGKNIGKFYTVNAGTPEQTTSSTTAVCDNGDYVTGCFLTKTTLNVVYAFDDRTCKRTGSGNGAFQARCFDPDGSHDGTPDNDIDVPGLTAELAGPSGFTWIDNGPTYTATGSYFTGLNSPDFERVIRAFDFDPLLSDEHFEDKPLGTIDFAQTIIDDFRGTFNAVDVDIYDLFEGTVGLSGGSVQGTVGNDTVNHGNFDVGDLLDDISF